MNDTKNRTTIMIIFAIVVIATVFLFFIITSKIEAVDWIGVMFILIAEVSFFCGLISIENHSSALMLRSGIYSVISIYSLTAIIVSVIFMLWFRESIITFISLQVAIIAITLILVVMFISFSMSAAKKNKEVLQSAFKLQSLYDKIMIISNDARNSEYVQQLKIISEELKYCDTSLSVPADDLIMGELSELESALVKDHDEKEKNIEDIVNKIILLVRQRSAEVKELKSGGI